MQNANTIAELAIAMPEAIPVLERLGIDYCCNGSRTIQHACNAAGITPDELLQLIPKATTGNATPAWDHAPLPELIRYIIDAHHVYTRDALQRAQALAQKVRAAHGERHQELLVVERLVAELTSDLIPHMLKEEQVLFPYILEPVPMPFFGTVRNPIRMMMLEHETVGEKLAELRELTMDYTVPDDACTSYKVFFNLLLELEADLHQHIHLENNILFPRALELETNERHNAECHCG